MRKASQIRTPWRDGTASRRSIQHVSAPVPVDTTGFTRVRLPTTAAQGAGKMAPQSRQHWHKVQTVGTASEDAKYELPVRTTHDTPDVHPMDRPKKKPARKQEKGDPDVHLD